MSDNPVEVSEFVHDPLTGEVFHGDGTLYPFKFFPQKSSKHKRGEFHTSDGRIIEFRPMNGQTLVMFITRFEDKHKPKIPKKPYDIGEENGKTQFSWESDPNDATYLEEMDSYNTRLGLILAAIQVSMGLKFEVPPVTEWSYELQSMFKLSVDPEGNHFEHQRKYFYLMSTLGNVEGNFLLKVLQGAEMPTVEGVKQAEARFPSDGE